MSGRHESVIVTAFAELTVPLAQLFGLYVLVHGHDSPGGGFQAGVILAATGILLALSHGSAGLRQLDDRALLALAASGVLVYLVTGAAALLAGAPFLDYGALPIAATPAGARYLGILAVETGIAVTVTATLLALFRRLADGALS